MGFLFGSNLDMNGGLGFGGSGNSSPRYVTDYTNGFELPGSTYTGGPVTTEDNTGALVTSPAGVLPIEGMRLATTVADGATLGPELFTQPLDFSTWNSAGTVLSASILTFETLGSGGKSSGASSLSIGKRYQLSVFGTETTATSWTIKDTTNQGTAPNILTANGTTEFVSMTGSIYARNEGSGVFTCGGLSIREVIPTWVPTDSSGDPIHASTPLRTTKGTVKKYDETYKGPLVEPARTNLFLNSTAPVTQNITTTAQAYTVTVLGTGSITLSGTATGTATQGSPLTVTASAGTLTCTVTGTLTRVNVGAGEFGTSFIDTAATTVTRPAANLTRPTAGSGLETGNNFAIYGRVVPIGLHTSAVLFSTYTDANNYFNVGISNAVIQPDNRIGGVSNALTLSYVHAAGVPFEYLCYKHGGTMGISVRSWNGSAWSAWSAWATNADTQNAPIASTYQIGARNNANHFAANYPFTEIIRLNPNLHPQTQLASLLAKGRI